VIPIHKRCAALLGLVATACWMVAALGLQTPSAVAASSSTDEKLRGAELFHEKGCEFCHGVDARGIAEKGPDLSTVGKKLKKDAIERQVRNGGGGMPAFGTALQPDELEALVAFLSAKKKAAGAN
jgi:cytochrome c551